MTDARAVDTRALFSPKIITDLEDEDRFVAIFSQFYANYADGYGCKVETNDRRFLDAHHHWREDAERMHLISDARTTELDHFKHAGIIAFWLRRMAPISDIEPLKTPRADRAANDSDQGTGHGADELRIARDRRQFMLLGTELSALFAGFLICLVYEAQKASPVSGTSQVLGLGPMPNLPERFETDFPVLMKTKNVSPQALYMMYAALFTPFSWRIGAAVSA